MFWATMYLKLMLTICLVVEFNSNSEKAFYKHISK